MKNRKWVLKDIDNEKVEFLINKYKIPKIIARLLVIRNLTEDESLSEFFNPDYSRLYNPFLFEDMEKAVLRIKNAILNKEKIYIYGDYDVDGITAVSLLYHYLKSVGANVFYYIPDRAEEGYGINENAIQYIIDEGAGLIITVDCGISAINEIDFAKNKGVDVIVTDHHECKALLPPAYAIINPKSPNTKYPFMHLSGVATAFKLVCGLAGDENSKEVFEIYSPIVALGTVADIMPLTLENRVIVAEGLKRIKSSKFIGLTELLKKAGVFEKNITASTLSFSICPRINAVGRLGSADRAVRLFISDDIDEIKKLADELCDENVSRQKKELEIFNEAVSLIENCEDNKKSKLLVVFNKGWHHGVIGIVSSKITEKYNKPSIVIAVDENNIGKGSGRSIKGFNLFEALNCHNSFLEKFGGHEMAVGMTISFENIEAFKDSITNFSSEKICDDDLTKKLYIDCEIDEKDIKPSIVKMISRFEPFGIDNKSPNFILKNARVINITAVGDGKHLKMMLEKNNVKISAIAFNMGDKINQFFCDDIISVVCDISINCYNGIENAQLIVYDIRKN